MGEGGREEEGRDTDGRETEGREMGKREKQRDGQTDGEEGQTGSFLAFQD